MFYLRAYPRHTINSHPRLFLSALKLLAQNKAQKGEAVKRFEEKFAEYIGVKHTVGVESARKGFYLILKNQGFAKGDEVIMPSYTFKALPLTVLACGLKPVFIDVDPYTYNINPALVQKSITPRTRAIIVTHMFGRPVDMSSIMDIARRNGLFVIEDCAHACGARYRDRRLGSWGDAAIFSFKMGKNLPCFGGGMITTDHSDVYEKICQKLEQFPFPSRKTLFKEVISTFIFYCVTHKNIFPLITYPALRVLDWSNSDFSDQFVEESLDIEKTIKSLERQTRLSNLQAETGLVQLAQLDKVNERRKRNARSLIKGLENVKNLAIPAESPHEDPTYLYFRIQVPDIKNFRKKLLAKGIDTKRDDMSACSRLEIFKEYGRPCPISEKLSSESLEIPNSPNFQEDDIHYIAGQVKMAAHSLNLSNN